MRLVRHAAAVHHVLIAAIACWAGFVSVIGLVLSHRSDGFDAAGVEMLHRSAKQALAMGPPWLLDAVRGLSALGGPLLRNLFASGAIAAALLLGRRLCELVSQ